ncbi:acetylglutamate kinase [Fodinibius salsisoli]|uniref:Acetylglutamate kinase n=1 Tax=Fodinibius salsisoli TaxID=2820877 RepID=A0ABT3PSR1_9BACT|nr:acetylglutamate kinase [Fodinibius salsisoli]MCW9708887.1 acetylglutamate kinase [Fodinibius salsisoli]
MQTLNIVKIGGSIANNEDRLPTFLDNFVAMDHPKILVHGGGSSASDLCKKLGIPIQMKDGRRITDKPALDVAVMVYAGLLNKKIVAKLQGRSTNAIGLSGADLNIIPAKKRNHPTIDFGFVGDITAEDVNTYFIKRLLDEQVVPVFPAITHDTQGQLFNTNADTIASVLAIALSDRYQSTLTYCFEKQGVLRDINDEESWIEEIDHDKYIQLKDEGIIHEGMIPKLDTAFEALQQGVHQVNIKHADNLLNLRGTKLTP